MNELSLSTDNLCYQYEKKLILSNINIKIKSREIVAIIGPNGSGKTTLLKTIANIISPTKGSIFLDQVPYEKLNNSYTAQKIGYLSQHPEVHWNLTVEQVIALGRIPYKTSSLENKNKIEKAMFSTNTQSLRKRKVSSLSGGERCRVMIARVLAGSPDILLLDEPNNGLDPINQLDLMYHLKTLAKEGCGILLILHDITHAARFCNRIIVMQNGIIATQGETGTVCESKIFQDVFGVHFVKTKSQQERLVVPWKRL